MIYRINMYVYNQYAALNHAETCQNGRLHNKLITIILASSNGKRSSQPKYNIPRCDQYLKNKNILELNKEKIEKKQTH